MNEYKMGGCEQVTTNMKLFIIFSVLLFSGCALAQVAVPPVVPAAGDATQIVQATRNVFELLQTILKVLKGTVSAIPILRNTVSDL